MRRLAGFVAFLATVAGVSWAVGAVADLWLPVPGWAITLTFLFVAPNVVLRSERLLSEHVAHREFWRRIRSGA